MNGTPGRESAGITSPLGITLLNRLLLQIVVVMVMVVMMGVYYHHDLRLRRKRHREAGNENQSKQILFHDLMMIRRAVLC
jgi:hypothetical protein